MKFPSKVYNACMCAVTPLVLFTIHNNNYYVSAKMSTSTGTTAITENKNDNIEAELFDSENFDGTDARHFDFGTIFGDHWGQDNHDDDDNDNNTNELNSDFSISFDKFSFETINDVEVEDTSRSDYHYLDLDIADNDIPVEVRQRAKSGAADGSTMLSNTNFLNAEQEINSLKNELNRKKKLSKKKKLMMQSKVQHQPVVSENTFLRSRPRKNTDKNVANDKVDKSYLHRLLPWGNNGGNNNNNNNNNGGRDKSNPNGNQRGCFTTDWTRDSGYRLSHDASRWSAKTYRIVSSYDAWIEFHLYHDYDADFDVTLYQVDGYYDREIDHFWDTSSPEYGFEAVGRGEYKFLIHSWHGFGSYDLYVRYHYC